MNKIQYIELLKLRGITELNGITVAQAVKNSGGEPTEAEMVKVNHAAMLHYLNKMVDYSDALSEANKEVLNLKFKVKQLEERDQWLSCLEAAGVDNWEGYGIAQDMLEDLEGENK